MGKCGGGLDGEGFALAIRLSIPAAQVVTALRRGRLFLFVLELMLTRKLLGLLDPAAFLLRKVLPVLLIETAFLRFVLSIKRFALGFDSLQIGIHRLFVRGGERALWSFMALAAARRAQEVQNPVFHAPVVSLELSLEILAIRIVDHLKLPALLVP